ncbi:MAG: glycosyltransferase family 1 protein [Candidatus Micrarchaeia archaeon]
MKIAWFTDTYFPQMNGVVAYIADAVRVLSRDHQVVLFAPGEGPLHKESLGPNLSIYWIPSSPFPFYEGYRIASMDYRRISEILRKEAPDIIHAHAPINLGLQGLLAAKRKRIRSVVTYHTHFPDYVPHLINGRLPGVFSRLSDYTVKKMIKHVLGKADVVTAPTMELADELRSYGLRNVAYLPNGIDLGALQPDPVRTRKFKARWGLAGKKVILYLGRISFEKRVENLLEAFRIIERPGRVLVIAGGGPYLGEFRDFSKALGIKNVVFTGFIENKAEAYSSADIFVSASDSETFGLTFVEAMHMGLPVVGIRRLGPKEVIGGGSGILVEPGGISQLAGAMDRLLKDPALRKRMGAHARKRAQRYTIEKSVGSTLEIYRRLLGKHHQTTQNRKV